MEFPELGKGAAEALTRARENARSRGLEHPESPDILRALLDSEQAIRVLELFDDEPEKIRVALDFMTRSAATQSDDDAEQRIVDLTRAEAGRLGHDEAGADHLLLGLVRDHGSIAAGLLWSFGLTLEPTRQALRFGHGQLSQWERPRDTDTPSRVTAWAPMDAVPMDDVPAWVRDRAPEIDAMPDIEVGLQELDRVVAIGQAVDSSTIVVEMIALEIRQTGAILSWRTRSSEDRLLGSARMTIVDDVGTQYDVLPLGWSGGGRDSRGETLLTPRPPEAARTMLIEIRSFEDADWMIGPFPDPPPTDGVLGPWRFEIPLRP